MRFIDLFKNLECSRTFYKCSNRSLEKSVCFIRVFECNTIDSELVSAKVWIMYKYYATVKNNSSEM